MYIAEAVLKNIALGPWRYIKDNWWASFWILGDIKATVCFFCGWCLCDFASTTEHAACNTSKTSGRHLPSFLLWQQSSTLVAAALAFGWCLCTCIWTVEHNACNKHLTMLLSWQQNNIHLALWLMLCQCTCVIVHTVWTKLNANTSMSHSDFHSLCCWQQTHTLQTFDASASNRFCYVLSSATSWSWWLSFWHCQWETASSSASKVIFCKSSVRYGPSRFLLCLFSRNKLDLVIVILAVVDIFVSDDKVTSLSSVFRIFRVVRLLKVLQQVK